MRFLIFILSAVSCLGAFNPAQVAGWHPTLFDGLVAAYSMDEASGTRYTSWGEYSLTDVNTVATSTGVLGNCITNSGATKYLTGSSNLVNYTTMTWSYWVWPATTAIWRSGQDTGATAQRRIILQTFVTSLKVYVATNNELATVNYASVTISTSAWNHIVITFEPTQFKIYTNGALATTKAVVISSGSTAPLSLGANGVGGNPMCGSIDEFGIWNRALTDDEIKMLFNSGRARRFPFNSGP